MGHKQIKDWKDCRDDRNITSAIKDAGGTVREAAGSHLVGSIPGKGSITYYRPHGGSDISTGVAVKIFKTLRLWGIIGIILLGFWLRTLHSCGPSNYTSVLSHSDGTFVYVCK